MSKEGPFKKCQGFGFWDKSTLPRILVECFENSSGDPDIGRDQDVAGKEGTASFYLCPLKEEQLLAIKF